MYGAVLDAEARELAHGESLFVQRHVERRYLSEGDARTRADQMPLRLSLTRRVSLELRLAYTMANLEGRQMRLPRARAGHRVVAADAAPPASPEHLRYVHELSRAGFNARGDSALVLVSSICGMVCGHGSMALVVQQDGRWHVAKTLDQWQH